MLLVKMKKLLGPLILILGFGTSEHFESSFKFVLFLVAGTFDIVKLKSIVLGGTFDKRSCFNSIFDAVSFHYVRRILKILFIFRPRKYSLNNLINFALVTVNKFTCKFELIFLFEMRQHRRIHYLFVLLLTSGVEIDSLVFVHIDGLSYFFA